MGSLNDLKQQVEGLANQAKDKAQDAADTTNDAVNKTADAACDAASAVKDAADKAAGSAKSGATQAADASKGGFDSARRAAGEVERRFAADGRITPPEKSAVRNITNTVSETVNTFVGSATKATGNLATLHTGGEAHVDDLPKERLLMQTEIDLAKTVFRDTLPYGAIYLSDQTGKDNLPYTIPHPTHAGAYVIHIGATAYNDQTEGAARADRRSTFIHELTHVWQGEYYANTPLDYVGNSVWDHATTYGKGTYSYEPGEGWNTYTVEQQASIVEDWFKSGLVENDTDPLWHYIRDNIRPAKKRASAPPTLR